tara:strand:+ start:83 stop:679 length:597 start_codon:yes stop_codon:yes gene_type:complete
MTKSYKTNYKVFNLPNEWFFFNPLKNPNNNFFYKISNHTGVVFFHNKNEKNCKFLEQIKPFVKWCKIKRMKFLVQCTLSWANKYKPCGILIDQDNCQINNMLNIQVLKKKFLIATKIHNDIEAHRSKDKYNIFFISNVFLTDSHPKRRSINFFRFFFLCNLLRKKIVFALGGVNKENYNRLKNKNLNGFGGISCFIKK